MISIFCVNVRKNSEIRLAFYQKVSQKYREFEILDDIDKFLFLNENDQIWTATFISKAFDT